MANCMKCRQRQCPGRKWRSFLRRRILRNSAFVGRVASSKTNVLVLDALSGVGRGFKENYKAIIIRGTQREFSDIIKLIDGIARPIWPSMKFNKLKNYFEFPEGETLELSYFEREADFPLYQGREFPFIGFEELQNFEDWKCYTLMFSCKRSPIPKEILPRKIRFTCNPSRAVAQSNQIPVRIAGRAEGPVWPVHRRERREWHDCQTAHDLFRL